MKKDYNHLAIEKRWQKEWEKKKVFKTEYPSKQKKFYILDMFPYPSGEGLHVGHPKGYIATDVVSRMKRMQGYNVLHPMGWDAFGLPAENYAIKTKTTPEVAVKKNIATFKKQLGLIGLDYDWSREVNTTDPKYYKWTQWIFLKLLEKGLAFESNEPVNWCPVDKTILANEDVEDGKCERCGAVVEKRPIRQWVLRITDYAEKLLTDLEKLDWPESIKESQRNWIGKSVGAEIDFEVSRTGEKIKIFTTRPDTIFGATYVVLAPEHELVKKLWNQIENKVEIEEYINEVKNKTEIERTGEGKDKTGVELKGIKAVNPGNGERIPVWMADYVLSNYGTGAIMAVPAHDERDYEFALKFNLPIKIVIEPETGKVLPNEQTRKSIVAIVEDKTNKKFLTLNWGSKLGGTLFIGGGREEGEREEDTGRREIQEETGVVSLKFIGKTELMHHHYFAFSKNVARNIEVVGLHFELTGKEIRNKDLQSDEKGNFKIEWLTQDEIFNKMEDENHLLSFKRLILGQIYSGKGILTNSGKFTGMDSEKANKEITKFVHGKTVVKYKLRDWVFSRQRYWGEPIPVLRDGDKVIPLKEKDLPLRLPRVKSYEPTGTEESPLAGIPSFINAKMGNRVLKRESNTMPQWAGSSWYYLRYMDPKNNKSLVDKKKEKYWNTVDLYVGGAEHATRHLIYARFWHKFLYDIGVVSTKEPFKRLQNVGLIIASDGRKMSKRFGNVINPDHIVRTFGADSLRLYEMFMGPFNQTVLWGEDNIVGVRRFLERVWRMQERISNKEKTDLRSDIILNQTIKKVGEDIENMNFNTAVSAMMILSNEIDKKEKINKKVFEQLLQILSPFAPHITEELWRNLGHKTLLATKVWPKFDPKKIMELEVNIAVQINGKVRAECAIPRDSKEGDAVNIARGLLDIEKWLIGKDIKRVIYVPNKIINFLI